MFSLIDNALIGGSIYLSKIADISLDPLKIIKGANDSHLTGDETLLDKEFVRDDRLDVYTLLDLRSLYGLLKRDLMLLAAIALVICLLKFLVLKRPASIENGKADVIHKIIIVLIASSILTGLNMIYKFFASLV